MSVLDLFALRLLLWPLDTLYIFDVVFIILVFILLAGLFFIQAVFKTSLGRCKKDHHYQHRPSVFTHIFMDLERMSGVSFWSQFCGHWGPSGSKSLRAFLL
ncbi:hypothetical protein AN958_08462 [Leucoagaricus sp. SymC.cos]|nr:hypothetical protein AN958_08462 [Leucoagaricus sp. SymC.cos]